MCYAWLKFLVFVAALSLSAGAFAQQAAGAQNFAGEDRDWGVAPTLYLRQQPYHAPTPRAIPGAQVVTTLELRAMLANPAPPVLIDVMTGEGHLTVAGANWIANAGRGTNFLDPVQSNLIRLLAQLTGNDKARALVFFCLSSECWLSYNAALRAVVAGYGKVYWYRGGIEAWAAAGLPTAKTVASP
jgi:PQQ-dependent catabolism-associated CXXCW motif protein